MITLLPQGKASPVNSVRVHEPMPLANPFIKTYKLTQSDINAAYKAYLLNRINEKNVLIIHDMDEIANRFMADDLTLIGPEEDSKIILEIIQEAING